MSKPCQLPSNMESIVEKFVKDTTDTICKLFDKMAEDANNQLQSNQTDLSADISAMG